MPCKILFSNQASIGKAIPVMVVDADYKFSAKESMQEFILQGGLLEGWSRVFSEVYVTDKTKEELSFINDSSELDPYKLKWSFIEPPTNTTEWKELYLTGRTEQPWLVVSQYIVERT